jgi:hypothetical protein
MGQTFDATYDGNVLKPDSPLSLEPNTRVRVTVEEVQSGTGVGEPHSFLRFAKLLKLEGPEDWSENIDHYLYGVEKRSHE